MYHANEVERVMSAQPYHDHFSKVAKGYSAYRPLYPAALFDTLAELAPSPSTVWDCAAGSGQASLPLGDRFATVFASDASANQIAKAPPHARVHYGVALAEACPLRSACTSLVTVAQALHWFDVEPFYREVKRILVPNGILAVWSYGLLRVNQHHEVHKLIHDFSERTLGAWWPSERRHVDAGYSTISFPFERVDLGPFAMTATWTLEQLTGYLRTWSSVSRKKAFDGVDAVEALEPTLREAWGNADTLILEWPLTLLAGRPG